MIEYENFDASFDRKYFLVCKTIPPAVIGCDHPYLGISQRDLNYYPFLNERDMERQITDAVNQAWEENVKGKWEVTRGNCQ